jgi:putative ABC transport system ATP-binding protein
MELLRELATTQRRAVVVVTHDPRLERFADRVVRVEDGHIQSIPPSIPTAGQPGPESPRSVP